MRKSISRTSRETQREFPAPTSGCPIKKTGLSCKGVCECHQLITPTLVCAPDVSQAVKDAVENSNTCRATHWRCTIWGQKPLKSCRYLWSLTVLLTQCTNWITHRSSSRLLRTGEFKSGSRGKQQGPETAQKPRAVHKA